ncbi:MAG: hypothetical protein QXG91_01310 [Candidatus Aenigmatarchaeota archaeon]
MKKIKKLLLLAASISFLVYFFGIYTGIIIGEKIIKRQDYSYLENEMKNLQLQMEEIRGVLILTKSKGFESCKLLEKILNKYLDLIWKYNQLLPYRIEEYELNKTFGYEMQKLKESSMRLSLNAWLISLEYSSCNNKTIPVLYVYKKNCYECILQGIEMDEFRDYLYNLSYMPIIFTIDLDLDYSLFNTIKEIYEIKDAPSIILHSQLFGFSNSTFLINFFEGNKAKEKG